MIEKIGLAIVLAFTLYWSTQSRPQPKQAALGTTQYAEVVLVANA